MKHKTLRFGKGFHVAIGNARSQGAEMVLALGDKKMTKPRMTNVEGKSLNSNLRHSDFVIRIWPIWPFSQTNPPGGSS